VQPAVLARQLDRALVGLGAAVREEGAHAAAQVIELLRQLDLALVDVQVGDVDQPLRLVDDGLDHGRMRVAEHVHRDAGDQVEVHAAVAVPDAYPLAALHDERAGEGALVILVLQRDPVALLGLCRRLAGGWRRRRHGGLLLAD
jgi:hypothetical protein